MLGRNWVGVCLIGYVESVAFLVLHGLMEVNILLTGYFAVLLNKISAIVACCVGIYLHWRISVFGLE